MLVKKIEEKATCLKCGDELTFFTHSLSNLSCGINMCTKCDRALETIHRISKGRDRKGDSEDRALAIDGWHDDDIPNAVPSVRGAGVHKRFLKAMFETEIVQINQYHEL